VVAPRLASGTRSFSKCNAGVGSILRDVRIVCRCPFLRYQGGRYEFKFWFSFFITNSDRSKCSSKYFEKLTLGDYALLVLQQSRILKSEFTFPATKACPRHGKPKSLSNSIRYRKVADLVGFCRPICWDCMLLDMKKLHAPFFKELQRLFCCRD
jgi:hypothetical protein